ncbi:MAG: hypothetical protein HY658_04355, partial [Actinobacteria bacterium]|nr:hypothetical protein [Actinomycetota bacterium]
MSALRGHPGGPATGPATGPGDGLAAVRRRLHRRLLEQVGSMGLELVGGPERRLRVRERAMSILRAEGHILP